MPRTLGPTSLLPRNTASVGRWVSCLETAHDRDEQVEMQRLLRVDVMIQNSESPFINSVIGNSSNNLTLLDSTLRCTVSGRGTTRAEDAQGTPIQGHMSPNILVYEDKMLRSCVKGPHAYAHCPGSQGDPRFVAVSYERGTPVRLQAATGTAEVVTSRASQRQIPVVTVLYVPVNAGSTVVTVLYDGDCFVRW